jgi:hypothetical protein
LCIKCCYDQEREEKDKKERKNTIRMDARKNTAVSNANGYQAAASVDGGFDPRYGRAAGQQSQYTPTPSRYSTVDVYEQSAEKPYNTDEGLYISSQPRENSVYSYHGPSEHRETMSPAPSVHGSVVGYIFTLFFSFLFLFSGQVFKNVFN